LGLARLYAPPLPARFCALNVASTQWMHLREVALQHFLHILHALQFFFTPSAAHLTSMQKCA
jgi:hypothetical protein